MQRVMLKSKIHRATVTGCELAYEGSITIDEGLLKLANILPGEQVHVLNFSNAARFITYAIKAPKGSGTVMLNGPAALLGKPGDLVIVLTYCTVSDKEARRLKPKVICVDSKNRPAARK